MAKDSRIGLARNFRKNPAPAEAMLWNGLRNRFLAGFKFRRQHPIGPYLADFACVECKVVVELDGQSHLGRVDSDQDRTRFMEEQGWLVLRFWNKQIYDEFSSVEDAIRKACAQRAAHA